ncbi:oxygen-independent coproporphyrinogen III oxidase [Tolypothrix sp. LEGE 11397]|uniref:oxygen-independent coproporphyrinogen III oxidase n=1 Tax=unclassified Tolypothrix TaxID=2649714 RepID=UPI000B5DCD7E|nr:MULTISPECIES: oxygen-independent coproporphyrinogen III oxidase [unclassified Tolypothrix]MBE9082870.1 oxygen-independent coproporphyrinogen III oxidase [Tolypothrix sp. LEGE 11397]UYD27271.1 oxygen-independent coproporphyrinogen III oxidase [Tolypothrix sp. PCC 7712]UYD36870.1 oxygen-independent coproporphyrinogen III oxidase [Tolypothrix sp. PCC 7601]BAY93422.1 coproporphyrinogen III oxidase [Microchaete diplosiphon NIES-3275]
MKLATQTVQFNSELLRKYDQALPRYTSYPPATELQENFGELDLRSGIAVGNYKNTPLSLYFHIPFCETACYFCGCNTIITQKKEIVEPYLNYVVRNLEQFSGVISSKRKVHQLHFGGGTPNYLTMQQMDFLWNKINRQFRLDEQAEFSIEINPRYVDKNYIFFLKNLGFNRISFGIQDFNTQVQEAINRVQPEKMLFDVMEWIRDAGFESVNVDLIYGLPYQSLATFKNTIEKTLKLDPDRVAVFNFAYVPWMKPIQRKIPQSELPQASEKLEILKMTIEELTGNGYWFIGMDHFAKPNDELTIAQQQGQLHRNFQGYTTKPESDLFGFGITSISMLHDVYVQNIKQLKSYYQAIDTGLMPIEKGVSLNRDDILRRTVIMELMCQFQLSINDVEEKYHIAFDTDFNEYFARELSELRLLEADGLIRMIPNGIEVTPSGRLLIRNIASVFDAHTKKRKNAAFSKAI